MSLPFNVLVAERKEGVSKRFLYERVFFELLLKGSQRG